MKKSLILGIAAAASFAFAEAAWVKSGPAVGSEQSKSITTLGSLVNERSVSNPGSLKYAAADTAKAGVSGLSVESKSIGTRWKDGVAGALVTDSGNFGIERSYGGNAPEASTWSAIFAAGAMVAGHAWRRSRQA